MITMIEALLRGRSPLRLTPNGYTEIAGVLMLLREEAGECQMFFIKRAEDKNDPFSGNMAFPGGRKDEEDGSPLDTAIRETLEETGIDLRQGGRILGTLDDVWHTRSPRHHYLITPYVAQAPPRSEVVLSEEVADAVWVPLSSLRDPGNYVTVPYYYAGGEVLAEGIQYRGYFIWGITGGIVCYFLSLTAHLFK